MGSTPIVANEYTITYGSIKIDSVGNGDGIYTLESDQDVSWVKVGIKIAVHTCSNAANNGIHTVTAVAAGSITTDNTSSVTEAAGSPGEIAFPVGGSSDFEPHDHVKLPSHQYERTTTSFDCVFAGVADDATFQKYKDAINTVFRKPYQRLRFLLGTETLFDFNPNAEAGGNTGFNARPSISEPGDAKDSDRSRLFRISIDLELPADLTGRGYRRDASWTMSYNESRHRTFSFEGVYTAGGANDAKANYDDGTDGGAAWAEAQLTAVASDSGNFDKISEQIDPDEEGKVIRFSLQYLEIKYNQSSAGLNHAAIVNATYDFSRAEVAPGDSAPDARRLQEIQCVFECSVDFDQTTNLESLFDGTIKPYLIDQAKSIFSLNGTAVVQVRPTHRHGGNRISVIISIQAVGDSSLIEYTLVQEVVDFKGKKYTPAAAGDQLAHHRYLGPRDLRRITSEVLLEHGSASAPELRGGGGLAGSGGFGGFNIGGQQFGLISPNSGAAQTALVNAAIYGGNEPGSTFGEDGAVGGGGGGAGAPGFDGWDLVSETERTRPEFRGLPPDQLEFVETTRVIVEKYITAPTGGGGGGNIAT